MANRTLDYLIRLVPDTTEFTKIREKIKKIDMGEFIQFTPTEAKKLKRILEQEVSDVGAQAGNIGKRLQDGLAKGLDPAKLQELFEIDTKKLKDTMEIIGQLTDLLSKHSGSDSWLKDGKGFLDTVLGASQKLSGLEASLGALETKFAGLDALLTSTIARFDALEQKIASLRDVSGQVVSPFNFGDASKEVDADVRKIQESLDKVTSTKVSVRVGVKSTSDQSVFEDYVAKIDNALENLVEKEESLRRASEDAVPGSEQERQANIALAQALLERANLYKKIIHLKGLSEDKTSDAIRDAGVLNFDLESIEKEFEIVTTRVADILGKLTPKGGANGNAIGISVVAPSVDDIKKAINDVINEINSSPNALNKIKLRVDEQLDLAGGKDLIDTKEVNKNKEKLEAEIAQATTDIADLEERRAKIQKEIDDSQHPKKETRRIHTVKSMTAEIEAKKALIATNQELLAKSDDQVTQQSLSAVMRSFESIGQVIAGRRESILAATNEWRRKMMEAMSIDKGAVNIEIGFEKGLEASLDVLYNEVNRYFEENQIELHINKDAFIQEIKDAVASGGVSVGTLGGGAAQVSGPVSFDPTSLMSVIATLFNGLATGDFTPVDILPKQPAAQAAPHDEKPKSVYLNLESPYIQDQVKAFKSLVEYSQTEGKPASLVRKFLEDKGTIKSDGQLVKLFDLKALAESDDMVELADALSRLMEMGGSTLLDEFDRLIGNTGKNKLLTNYRNMLSDLLYTQNMGQVSIDEDMRRSGSIEVFKDYATRYKLSAAMRGIWKTDDKKWTPPNMAELDSLIELASKQQIFSRYLTTTDDQGKKVQKPIYLSDELKLFRRALSKIGDLNDEDNKEKLLATIATFKSKVKNVYTDLLNHINAFEMDVDVDGHKKPYRVKGGNKNLRSLLNAIGDNYDSISDVRIYKDTSTGTLGVSRQEGMLNRGYGTKSQLIVPYPDQTDILHRDRSIPKWSLSKDTVHRWEDSEEGLAEKARGRVDAMAEEAAERRKESAEKANQRAKKRKQISEEITNIESQISAKDTEIESNEARIAEISSGGKKLVGARTRLNNRKSALDAAKREYEGVVSQYEPWLGYMDTMPINVHDEIAELLYDEELSRYYEKKRKAKTEDERNKYDGLIKQIFAKMSRATDEDKMAFDADLREYLFGGAASRNYQSAQREYDRVLSDPYVQQVVELDELVARNEQLARENKSLRKLKGALNVQHEQNVSVQGRLGSKYQERKAVEIDKLLRQAEDLQQKINQSKIDADKLDAFVQQTMTSDEYKKRRPIYDIDYSDDDRAVVNQQSNLRKRFLYLQSVIDGTYKPDDNVPNNVTDDMAKTVESLRSTQEVIRLLSKDFGFDKFTSGKDLEADVRARLDRHASGQSILPQIVEEFYNKILSSGFETADKWRRDTLASSTQDRSQQLSRLQSFAQEDESLIASIKPEVANAENNLKTIFKERVRAWADSIKSKIGELESDSLSSEERGLLIKEIEQLFGLIDRAKSKYIEKFTSGEHYSALFDLQRQKEGKEGQEISDAEYRSRVHALTQENERRLFDELLADNEELMARRSSYIYSAYRDANIHSYTSDIDSTHIRLDRELREREPLLLTRQAELFGDIERAHSEGKSTKKFETELKGVNDELARYEQHRRQIAAAGAMSLFYDDPKVLDAYKNGLAEIIRLEQEALLGKSKGASQETLDGIYGQIDSKRQGLDDLVYTGLSSKRDGLLAQIRQNTAETQQLDDLIADLRKNGADAATIQEHVSRRSALGTSTQNAISILEAINAELVKLEVHKRRTEAMDIGKPLYKADVTTVQAYNTGLKETIELEQKLALAEARGGIYRDPKSGKEESVQEIQDAIRKKKAYLKNSTERFNASRKASEAAMSHRAQAFGYLMSTEGTYKVAQEAEYTARRRRQRDERELDDILNNEKYSRSSQYKKHQEAAKREKVSEYISSDAYQADRAAGMQQVAKELKMYLRSMFGISDELQAEIDRILEEAKASGKPVHTVGEVKQLLRTKLQETLGTSQEAVDNINAVLNAEEKINRLFYEFMNNQHGKTGDRVDPEKFKEAYGNLVVNGDVIAEAWSEVEEQFKSGESYRALEAERQSVLDKALADTRAAIQQADADIESGSRSQNAVLQQQFDAIDQELAGNVEFLRTTTVDNYPLLREEIDKLLMGADPNSIDEKRYEEIVDKARGRLITKEQSDAEHRKKVAAREHYLPTIDEISKPIQQETKEILNRAVTDYMRSYMTKFVNLQFTNDEFRDEVGGKKATELTDVFRQLMEQYVYSLVSNYAKSLEVVDGMLDDIDIRERAAQEVRKRIEILEGEEKSAAKDTAYIEGQRKAAMKDGGIGYGEVADAEVLRNQTLIAAELRAETEKRAELVEQIAALEKEGGQSKEVERLNAELKKTEEYIGELQHMHDSRDTLIEMRHQQREDEKAAERWDPKQQKLDLQEKIALARIKMRDADDVTRRELEEKITHWTGSIERIDEIIAQREADAAEAKRKQVYNNIKGFFGGGFGGGIGDTSGLATEATLQQVLQALIGGKAATVVKDPKIEAKRARIAELEAELGATTKPTAKKSKAVKTPNEEAHVESKRKKTSRTKKSAAPTTPRREYPEGFNFIDSLKAQAEEVAKYNKGTKEYILEQAKLYKLLWDYKDSDPSLKALKNADFLKRKEVKSLGLDPDLRKLKKQKEAFLEAGGTGDIEKMAREFVESFKTSTASVATESKTQVENERRKTVETKKQAENARQAAESTAVLDKNKKEVAAGTSVADLKPGQKDDYEKYIGKTAGSYKTSDAIFADPNAVRAKVTELQGIISTAAKDSEEYLLAIVEMSKLISTWRAVVKKTNPEVAKNDKWKEYLTSGEGKLFDSPDDVPLGSLSSRSKVTIKQTAMNLGTKISADAASALALAQQTAATKEREVVAEEKITEEKKEQREVAATPRDDTKAKRKELARLEREVKDYKPKMVDGDGGEFSGVATEGTLKLILDAVNKVLTNGVPRSGSKSVGAKPKESDEAARIRERALREMSGTQPMDNVGELSSKVAGMRDRFDAAKQVGYLNEADEDLTLFTDKVKAIADKLAKGGSFEEIEKMMNEAAAIGDRIDATVKQNKKLYTGTAEIGKVEAQRSQMMASFGHDFFDSSLTAVRAYSDAYDDLIKKYEEYRKAGTLYEKEKQVELSQQALRLHNMGKDLTRSYTESQRLQQLVEDSGEYRGKPLGATKELTDDEMVDIEGTMRAYLNSLQLGNIEGVKFDNVHKTLTGTLRTSNRTVSDLTMKFNDATQSLYLYQKQERESLTGMLGFLNDLQKKGKSILSYLTYTTSIYRIISMVRQGINYVKEIDAALTELRKVTDATEESYDKFLNTAAKTADKVGSTIKEVVSSTADWARLGYTIKEAATLAESTQILMNVSEFTDVSAATDALISSIQAFKYTAEESMGVVDIMNTIGNNYAISTADLATSLTKSSGSLVAANGTLEEAVALTATANTIIQDADVVGTALKTVAMRLRGTDTKTMDEEGIETDGVVTSKSKLRGKVKALSGVDILTDTGAYKSTYQILSEIADVWENISDMDQAALLELLAGKRAGSVMSAILQNPETLKDAFESANDAAGSALEENEKYLDSFQGRIDLFNNAIQTLWHNTLNDDFVKFIIDAGTGLVKIVDQLGLVKTLVMAIGTFMIQKHFKGDLLGGLFDTKTTGVAQVKQTLADLTASRDSAAAALARNPNSRRAQTKFNSASSALENYERSVAPQIKEYDALNDKLKTAQGNLERYQNRLNNYQGTNQNTIRKYQAAVDKAQKEVEDLEVQVESAGKKLGDAGKEGMTAGQKIGAGFKKAGKAVWKFGKQIVASIATMYVITTVMELISKLGHAIEDWVDSWVTTPEEAQEKFEKLNEELIGVKSELDNLNAELETTQDRIDELLSQESLSFAEQEELDRLRAENDELERSIRLHKTLEESKQRGVNAEAITATDKYLLGTSFGSEQTRSEKQEEWKETGETIGQAVGLAAAIALMVTGVIAEIPTLGASTGLVVAGASMLAGSWLGGAIGSSAAGTSYDSEQSVSEAMDNMVAQRAKLQKAQEDALVNDDTAAYNDATEALNNYDSQMAKHVDQIQANYNAMDWSTATGDQKKKMMEYADWLDKYRISMGADGAKSSAIERIFGGPEATHELKNVDKQIKDTIKSGGEVNFDEMFNSAGLADTKKRLYDMGVTITDLKYYYLDWKETEEEVEGNTYEVAQSVSALTSGIGELKDAFSEFQEEGIVTASTLSKLYDTFGSLGDAWDDYVDVMATGTASTAEARRATEELLEAFMNQGLANGPIKDIKEYLSLIGQLQNLGVYNAKDYVDALQKSSIISSVGKEIVNQEKELAELEEKKQNGEITDDEYNEKKANLQKSKADFIKQYEEDYGIELSDEEKGVLLEKAMDAERAQQDANAAQAQANARESAIRQKESTQEEIGIAEEYLRQQEAAGYYKEVRDTTGWQQRNGVWYNPTTRQTSQSVPTKKVWVSTGDVEGAQAALDDLQEKYDSIEIPAEVDVDNAEQQAEDAKDAYQQALDDMGLTIKIELYESGQQVDDIQSIYDTLASAQKEYKENGSFSVDTMQGLLELEPKYLALLYDENGQLNLNEEALLEVAKARIIDLGIKQKTALINDVLSLSEDGSTESLLEHMYVTGEAIKNNDDYIKSNMEVIRTNLERRKSEGLINIDVDAFMSGLNAQLQAIDRTTNIALSDLKNTISSSGNGAKDTASDEFQKAMSYWENRIGAEQSRFEQIQNEIDLLEKQGKIAGEDYYTEQIDSETRRLSLLQQQKAEAEKYLGQFEEGSDEWWEVANTLNDLENEIDGCTASIQDLTDAQAEVDWKIFDEFHERASNLHDELSTIRDLIAPNESEDWFDDEGLWTDKGTAYLATYISDLKFYESELESVNEKLNEQYNLPYAGNETYYKKLGIDSEQELYDKRQELIGQQHDIRKSMSDTQQSVKDMYESQIDAVEEWANEATEAYQDYIDVVKEALDAERD